MRTLIYGFLVALGLGAVLAPITAGLLGAAGMASSSLVRVWLFMIPETICGIAGDDNPGLAGLITGWTIEFLPLGFLIAAVAQVRAKRSATEKEAAFDQAVTTFHDSDYLEAEDE